MAIVAFDLARGSLAIPTPGPDGTSWDTAWSKFVNGIHYTVAALSGLQTATTTPGAGFSLDSALGDTVIRRATFDDGGGVFGVASATAVPLVTLDWTGASALGITLNAAWNTIRNFQLTQFTGTQLDLRNWVDVDLRLADAIGRSITIEGAKRGNIRLGDGNDALTIGVDSDTSKGGNSFHVSTGGGNDTVTVRASTADYYAGAYDGSWTTTVINTGSGDDTVFGWRSSDSVDGGTGTDIFVLRGLRAGYGIATANGVTTITDTSLADGNDGTDTLRNVEYVRFADASLLALGAAPVNRAPVAGADTLSLGETATASINLLANDSDPDGNALSVTAISGAPLYGTLSLAGGTATYTADQNQLKAGQTLSESFIYTLSDGALTATATLTVTIVGANDAPVVRATAATVTEDQATVALPALANASDPDGDVLNLVSASALSGTVSLDGGQVRYTPSAAAQALNTGQSAADTITYVVSDGRTTSTGTIGVTITGITDAPSGPVPTLTVGAGKQFATLASAIAASRDGDVIGIDAGTYVNDFAIINTKITIVGIGGLAHLKATIAPPNGKAILTTNTDVTVIGLEFSGAAVADRNGAGIRYQSGNLKVQDSFFHDNQMGLLSAANATGTITIDDSEFWNNGHGDGLSHNLYVGDIAKLTVTDSLFHSANVGHEIKSRARETVILDNRIFDGADGNGSYSIDLPNGGRGTIRGNVIEQGPLGSNPAIIHFGGEAGPYPGSSLLIEDNLVINHKATSGARLLLNQTTITAAVVDNDVFGLSSGQIATGPANSSGTTYLATDPPLDTSAPWVLIG